MNVLYKIKDKSGRIVRFIMNDAQLRVYKELMEHPRLVVLKSRQRGISTFMLINYLDRCLFEGGIEAGMMAQGEKEMENLFDKVKLAWDELDGEVRKLLMLETTKDTSRSFAWTNRSKMYLQLSFRSGTLQALHISEYAKISAKFPERADETRSGSLQAILPSKSNWIVIESTAEGENDFKRMWDTAVELKEEERSLGDFKPVFLSWLDDPDCIIDTPQEQSPQGKEYFAKLEKVLGREIEAGRKWWWEVKFREMKRDLNLMLREYPAVPEDAFYASVEGTWYKNEYEWLIGAGRLDWSVEKLYNPEFGVIVAMDLGVDDKTSIVIGQSYEYMGNHKHNLLLYLEGEGQPIDYYLDMVDEELAKRGWELGMVILPHDAKERVMVVSETVFNRVSKRWSDKAMIVTLKVPKAVVDGINAVRENLYHTWISSECWGVVGALQNYRKEYDKRLEVFREKPVHDRWSHPADALRYYFTAYKEGKIKDGAGWLWLPAREKIEADRGEDMAIDGMAL